MHLFGEGVTPEQVGVWLGCLAALLVIVHYALGSAAHVKALRAKPPRRAAAAQWVTKAELDAVEASMKGEVRRMEETLKGAETSLRAEVQHVEETLGGQIARTEEYSHRRLHELADALNGVALNVAAMPVRIREAIDTATAPLAGKIDGTALAVARIAARLYPTPPHGDEKECP
jgi:truncated hemoglobin YjbI